MPGLRQVVDGGLSPKVDVVAVHGLNPKGADAKRHAWETWTAGDKLWLRDELPKSFPDARVYLYEYDSRVFSNKPTFSTAANELLDKLTGARRKDAASRPLILIGHNLGGLLIKQALVNAHNNSRYSHIKDATVGLMFFATPHGGGKNRENVKANLGLTAASICGFVGFSSTDSIVEAVSPGSVFEDTLTEAFRHQLEAYTLVSFWGKRDTIVNEASATFGLPGYRETILPLDAAHSDICKFDMASQEDQDNYVTVENNFSWLFEKCVESIANQEMETRIQALLPTADRAANKTGSFVR
ncbi:hypothetical protein QBC47DRAFT_401053 [Echria macrotheca]|uniref:DUF676 domain-containing protein n=1 Tax=Echria macrotheca TaxID=438768 RepID=A0AAJ0BD83_9PEZI|nr:hypothetical protein QBC47DRAFT_401053 [Echria macrotheca]